jgi:hypothetical protein
MDRRAHRPLKAGNYGLILNQESSRLIIAYFCMTKPFHVMYSSVSKLCACLVILMAFACGEKSSTVRDSARESLGVNENLSTTTAPPPSATIPTGASGVMHYTCPNNCEGSGGAAAGSCPVCGTAYEHNQAFHNQTQQPTEKMTFPGQTTTVPADGSTPPPTPEPAQNASGVWHYTCANGCAGGAGGAGTCASCGGALAHNAAYHQ